MVIQTIKVNYSYLSTRTLSLMLHGLICFQNKTFLKLKLCTSFKRIQNSEAQCTASMSKYITQFHKYIAESVNGHFDMIGLCVTTQKAKVGYTWTITQ